MVSKIDARTLLVSTLDRRRFGKAGPKAVRDLRVSDSRIRGKKV